MKQIRIDTASGPRAALLWDTAPATSPWLHFAHATGMHAGLYARLLAPLADRFRIVASDARGHGRTAAIDPRPPEGGNLNNPPHGGNLINPPEGDRVEWEVFAADTLAITAAVDANTPWILARHSMPGWC